MGKRNEFEKTPAWIATRRIHFNKDLRYSLTPETERLLYRVADHTTISHNYDQMEEAFFCLLANLYHAEVMDAPLVYSRNSNAYTIERERYGHEFYTYGMIVRLVDAMYDFGLIDGVKGRQESNGRCRSSKIWATETLKEIFCSAGGSIFIKRNDEVLYLKDAKKRLCNYPDDESTRSMRRQVEAFNEMLGALNITFTFDYAGLSDRAKPRVNKLYKLISLLSCNQVSIVSPYSTQLGQCQRGILCAGSQLLTKYYSEFDHDAKLRNELNGLVFIGAVNGQQNYMRRIFNEDWQHGGRFYQAPHITMPSACRKSMLINGEPTVELDYSGLHIRMLYNHLGDDYRDECYVYEKGDDTHKDDRERIKLASLIVVNSSDRRIAIKAIHNQCRKKGIHYPEGQFGRYGALVDLFKDHHGPIKQFLLSGKGLELQYQDSTIMASILERMTQKGIPALPVHDSVICPARHQDFLRQVMVEEYEKVMGFKPVL